MPTDWTKLHGDAFRGTRALVTGGAGFIGSHLVDALVTLGADVTVLDDMSGGDATNLNRVRDDVDIVQASILDESAVARAAVGAQYVFHLAALVSVPASVERPRQYEQVNITGTASVLDVARKSGVRRVMFSASSSAYGDSEELPKIETMPPMAMSPYAATKVAGEQLIRSYARSYATAGESGFDAVALRYFNIFGPRQNANSAYAGVIAAFAKAILSGSPPRITGDGTATRDFTFVHNAVHANLLAARHDRRLDGDVFNVATARRMSITELADAMVRLAGRPDLKPVYAPARPGDVKHSQAELTKTRVTLGYEPIVDFETGLKATLEWYREALGSAPSR
jgi:nucleoside-diphosphate-sugar epimerase